MKMKKVVALTMKNLKVPLNLRKNLKERERKRKLPKILKLSILEEEEETKIRGKRKVKVTTLIVKRLLL